MRRAKDLSAQTLAQALLLPPDDAPSNLVRRNGARAPQRVRDQWSAYVGGRPVAIAPNLEAARQDLLWALGVVAREPVLVPANAMHSLVEAVKQSGAQPIFGALDHELQLCTQQPVRIAWPQPALGLALTANRAAEFTVLDHGDSVPLRVAQANEQSFWEDVAIFGLQLSSDPTCAGALLVFNSAALYDRFMAKSRAVEAAIFARAAAQLQRLEMLAPCQAAALTMVATGVQAAAGLPVLPVFGGAALAHGVAVRVPDEGSPATFWTYASSENTPVQWLPELRPLHYAAVASQITTAAHLERWLFVPVGPNNDEATNQQAVLGIVKTAEYLGLRWRNDPARAAQYAALLDAMYGPHHDAYRPVFAINGEWSAETMFCADEVVGAACAV